MYGDKCKLYLKIADLVLVFNGGTYYASIRGLRMVNRKAELCECVNYRLPRTKVVFLLNVCFLHIISKVNNNSIFGIKVWQF